jgi:hypothetical protein
MAAWIKVRYEGMCTDLGERCCFAKFVVFASFYLSSFRALRGFFGHLDFPAS